MRLNKFSRIRFGKEDYKTIPKNLRKDIIYKVFLGDRQIWSKTSDDEDEIEDNYVLDYNLNMIWHVYDTLNLGNVTSATSIAGKIDWGDGSVEDWESGDVVSHDYGVEGDYEVILMIEKNFSQATIGQIVPYVSNSTPTNKIPYLKSISFCKIPYLSTRLFEIFYREGTDPNLGMFEGFNKLEQVIVPIDQKYIDAKMFYKTGIKRVLLSTTINDIGYNAFIRQYNPNESSELVIRILYDNTKENNLTMEQINNSGLGKEFIDTDTGGRITQISNIKVYCPSELTTLINGFSSWSNTEVIQI